MGSSKKAEDSSKEIRKERRSVEAKEYTEGERRQCAQENTGLKKKGPQGGLKWGDLLVTEIVLTERRPGEGLAAFGNGRRRDGRGVRVFFEGLGYSERDVNQCEGQEAEEVVRRVLPKGPKAR